MVANGHRVLVESNAEGITCVEKIARRVPKGIKINEISQVLGTRKLLLQSLPLTAVQLDRMGLMGLIPVILVLFGLEFLILHVRHQHV